MSRLGHAVWLIISVGVVGWTLITAPLAIISGLSDLLSLQGFLLSPVDLYRRAIEEAAGQLGIMSDLPGWAVDAVMVGILCAGVGWLYYARLFLEVRKQRNAAARGEAIAVNPQAVEPDSLDIVLGGTSLAGFLVGGGVAKVMLASGAAMAGTGPIGWVIGPFVVAGAGMWALAKRDELRERAAREHAARESARLAAHQFAIAEANIRAFRRREGIKLLLGTGIVAFLILLNFVLPLVL